MQLSSSEMLLQLGAGTPIADVCTAAGITRSEFDTWWTKELLLRLPDTDGLLSGKVRERVQIYRDDAGIPRIVAANDEDLFFGFGYAMAKTGCSSSIICAAAHGRLSEILGPSGLELDLIARTVGLSQIATQELERLPTETRQLLTAFCGGVNAVIDASRDRLPIEFDLLGYVPEEWKPEDSLAVAGEFRWYLTGRFPVIAIPELAKRQLGGGDLYRAFVQTEHESETILPPGSYPSTPGRATPTLTGGSPDDGSGSNNWVVAGSRTTTGKPLVASDPHIAFAAVSCWYEVQLQGGSFNVAGMTYAGMPAVMFGRNPQVAWGITNNICSLRNLYQERTDPAHPGCFLYDGRWEPGRERIEVIHVKGAAPVQKTILSSRNGPIVDEVLPLPARNTGPVGLRWLGTEYCGWLTSLLKMDRARTALELRAAIDGWLVPTFGVVFADVEGTIGYHAAGRIPIRRVPERGYRQGWNPAHQWDGLIPFESMPQATNPERGWIVTANNRVAGDDFPYPLSGTWVNGQRAARVRQMIEERPRLSPADCARMQLDALSLRAVDCVPLILKALESQTDRRVRMALNYLAAWDCRMEPDRVAASIFSTFVRWSRVIVEERFQGDAVTLISGAVGGLATALLSGDSAGWFVHRRREEALAAALTETLDSLTQQFGPDMLNWGWGRLHKMVQKHFLSDRGELGLLLDRGGVGVKGDGVTVCNTGFDPNWGATMGAGYRLIADLSDPRATLQAIDAGSESGHPGSPHYDDQFGDWMTGRYHRFTVNGEAETPARAELVLVPA